MPRAKKTKDIADVAPGADAASVAAADAGAVSGSAPVAGVGLPDIVPAEASSEAEGAAVRGLVAEGGTEAGQPGTEAGQPGAEAGQPGTEAGQPGAPDPDKKWYVVHTYSGYEGKVRANLEKRVESMLMQDKIFRVIVPTEDEIEYKDGRKLISKKKIFPGYVLVEMIMSDDSWYVVRNTPGVTGFVGSGAKPVALDAAEVKTILRHMGVDEPRPKVMYEDGESVKVVGGPFMGFIGKVREVNLDKGKLRVFVSMFGRETPVELDFGQVEKL